MLGGDYLVCSDRRRADMAGEVLSAVPTLGSRTAAGLAERLDQTQLLRIEDGIAEVVDRAVRLLPARRRTRLRTGPATIGRRAGPEQPRESRYRDLL